MLASLKGIETLVNSLITSNSTVTSLQSKVNSISTTLKARYGSYTGQYESYTQTQTISVGFMPDFFVLITNQYNANIYLGIYPSKMLIHSYTTSTATITWGSTITLEGTASQISYKGKTYYWFAIAV